jgi:hypothetical protein
MTDELEMIWEEMPVVYSRCHPCICLKKLRKIKKNLTQDSWCPDRNSNQASSEYEYRALPLC